MEYIDLSKFKKATLRGFDHPDVCWIVVSPDKKRDPFYAESEDDDDETMALLLFSSFDTLKEFMKHESTDSYSFVRHKWHELVKKYSDRFHHGSLDPTRKRKITGLIPIAIPEEI